ncbi:MAG TPA: hypothetical protein ENI23_14170, partial [bacterium]|nr:hypothetical protein [bacterium]
MLGQLANIKDTKEPALFKQIKQVGSHPRFLALGWMQFYDLFGRLVWYRHLKQQGIVTTEKDNIPELAQMIGAAAVPLVQAYEADELT